MKPMRSWPVRRIRRIVEVSGKRVALLSCTHYRGVDGTARKTVRCRPCQVLLDRIDALRTAVTGRDALTRGLRR